MTPSGTCAAPHRTDPDKPRTALGEFRLCAGHYTALTDALTGPSAADDPTLDAMWGVRVNGHTVIRQPDPGRAADYARRAVLPPPNARRTWCPLVISAEVVCGDGVTWHDPRLYRPGALARAYVTLGTLLTGHVTATASAPVSGTTDWRLPIADHVAELRTQIRHDLAYWAATHADELRTTAPSVDDPAVLSGFLARYVDWSAAQDWAAEYVGVLGELHARARALVDLPQPRRVDVAACVEFVATATAAVGARCTGRLTTRLREDGDPRPAVIECDTCPAAYTSERWQRLGERIAADTRRGRTAA